MRLGPAPPPKTPPFIAPRARTADTPTFADLAARYLKNRPLKPSTIGPFTAYLDSQLLPAFGPRPAGQITPAEVARWFHAYSRNRPGGANQALGHFTTIFNWAKAQAILPAAMPNPAATLRKNRRRAVGRMLSFDQITALSTALDRARPRHQLAAQAIRLILLTGCRSGEIRSLRWSEVKPTRLTLTDAKTGPREVFLSTEAASLLANLKRRTGNQVFVFPSPKTIGGTGAGTNTGTGTGSSAGHIASMSALWESLKRNAGLPPTFRIHDLRHTYASHSILSGESLPITGRLLGHKSPKTTLRYAHLEGTTLAPAAENICAEIAKMIGLGRLG